MTKIIFSPPQDLQKITKTIEDAMAIRPDRIAFYSYAHVPWTSRAQQLFNERDLPDTDLKMIKWYWPMHPEILTEISWDIPFKKTAC